VFDFRCYLFGRQCSLLLRMGRRYEAARRARQFIESMLPSLQAQPDVRCRQ